MTSVRKLFGWNASLWIAMAVASIFAACAHSGDLSPSAGGGTGGTSPGGAPDAAVDTGHDSGAPCTAALLQKLKPELDVCRSCHIEGGLASGSSLMLTANPSDDGARLHAAYAALGDELLATVTERDGRAHPGGRVLRADGPDAVAMTALISAIKDPSSCDPNLQVQFEPVLGSAHGGDKWKAFCDGKSDDTPLPVDPRTLVQPGVSDGLSVQFNAPWVNCRGHTPVTTCGGYRAGYARGEAMMTQGKMWFFGGDSTDAMLQIPATQYNGLWSDWGFSQRPANFDQLLSERLGIPLGQARNPYPLPGEDPNATNGGSGQLPVALTQLRDQNGKWMGAMSFTCHWCHSGKVGDSNEGPGLGTLWGAGNPLLDVSAGFSYFAAGATAIIPLSANQTRGTGDILLYPAIAALDVDRAAYYNESLVTSTSQGSVDYPVFWNVGHRTRRFHDGSFAMDDSRPVMGFFMPIFRWTSLLDIAAGRTWIEARDQDVQLWVQGIGSPSYPKTVDNELAQAGAVLFHTKDLWATDLKNTVPRPASGNGSCASCHGAYATRYANDPTFLAKPELEGIASFITPVDVAGTDRARYDSLNDRLRQTLSHSWWGYGDNTTVGACFDGVPHGYLAPPLYGIWASAPYFHNGSVPNLWEVLKPSDRPEIWRRASTPAPTATPKAFMGFDANLGRAYDFDHLGWKYDALPCGLPGSKQDCTDVLVAPDPVNNSNTTLSPWFLWNLQFQPQTDAQLEDRKIYNTHAFSQGKQGHEFVNVLTDAERRALLEYLKTL